MAAFHIYFLNFGLWTVTDIGLGGSKFKVHDEMLYPKCMHSTPGQLLSILKENACCLCQICNLNYIQVMSYTFFPSSLDWCNCQTSMSCAIKDFKKIFISGSN